MPEASMSVVGASHCIYAVVLGPSKLLKKIAKNLNAFKIVHILQQLATFKFVRIKIVLRLLHKNQPK